MRKDRKLTNLSGYDIAIINVAKYLLRGAVGRSDKTGRIINKALPGLFNAKIGESLGLVLSRHIEAYTPLVKVQGKDCELSIPANPFDWNFNEIL